MLCMLGTGAVLLYLRRPISSCLHIVPHQSEGVVTDMWFASCKDISDCLCAGTAQAHRHCYDVRGLATCLVSHGCHC